MEMGDLRGLATILCMVGFAAIVWWAYGPSRKDYFDQAAQLPFADEAEPVRNASAREQ